MRGSGDFGAVNGNISPPCSPTANAGVALIAVLSLVALLSVIAIGVVGITRMRIQISARHFDGIQAAETLDSAIRLQLLELSASPELAKPLLVNGQASRPVSLFDDTVDLIVDLESGRIDINFADEATMTAAFVGNGFSLEEARIYAQRVLDWRDSDDKVAGSGGAEREAYSRAKLDYEPRNAPFESVSELRQVVGLEKLTATQLEAFTVFSHLPEPDEYSSVDSVRKALDWMRIRSNPSTAVAANDSSQEDSASSTQRRTDTGANQSVAGRVVRVRACVARKHVQLCRVAIVRFTGDINNPFLVFAWQTNFEDGQKVAAR